MGRRPMVDREGKRDRTIEDVYDSTSLGANLSAAAAKETRAVPLVTPGREVAADRLRGRDELLDRLLRFTTGDIIPTGPSGERRVWVLHGMGGTGKTTLALEVAHRAEAAGVRTWWLHARPPDQLIASLRAVAFKVHATHDELNRQHPADGLWERLQRVEDRWLLVVDNVDDLTVLEAGGRPFGEGNGWLRHPHTAAGFVLITSKLGTLAQWGPWCHLERLGTLERREGGLVLRDRAEATLNSDAQAFGSVTDAEALSETLGGLPLALDLASDYLITASTSVWPKPGVPKTFRAYREAFERDLEWRSGELDSRPISAESSDLTPLDFPIITSWELALDLLAGQGLTLARPLLRLLACFGPAPVPHTLVLGPEVLSRSQLFAGASLGSLSNALDGLRSVGLVDVTQAGVTARDQPLAQLHPVVRRTNRLLPEVTEHHAEYSRVLAALLNRTIATYPADRPENWWVWDLIAAHCTSPLMFGGHLGIDSLNTDDVDELTRPANEVANYSRAKGFFAEAERGYRQVLTIRKLYLGNQHPATLLTQHNLAGILRDRGRYMESEEEYRIVLRIRQQELGDADPQTLNTRHALAEALRDRGQYDLAEAEYRAILDARCRTLGEDHPATLDSRQNLAFLLDARGRHADAEQQFLKTLERQPGVEGENSPRTMSTRHNYARLKQDMGRLADAEADFRAVLEQRIAELGSTHPDTLSSRHALAYVLQAKGSLDAAEAEYEAILEVQRGSLGEDHRDTLGTRHNLASLWRDQGRYARAEEVYREVLDRRLKILGEEHPDTLVSRFALAQLQHAQGKFDVAERKYRAILAAQNQLLGSEHPSVLGTRHALGVLLQDRQQFADADREFTYVVKHRATTLGANHPDTLATRHALAYLQHIRGQLSDAATEYRAIIAAQIARLGGDDLEVLATRGNLARLEVQRGNFTAAETEFRIVAEGRATRLGQEHPETIAARARLEVIEWLLSKPLEPDDTKSRDSGP